MRSAQISYLKTMYARIADAIEAVPPDEADYIRKEKAASLKFPGNRARFNLVYSNRFYQGVEVRDAVGDVIEHLDAANAASPRISSFQN